MMTEEKSSKSIGLSIEQTHRDGENRMERGGGEELSREGRGRDRSACYCFCMCLLTEAIYDAEYAPAMSVLTVAVYKGFFMEK
jgi:hypothetical protein